MAEIFDFIKFKEEKERCCNECDRLENEYLEFLPWINKKLGVPTDISSVSKIMFIVMRYLEGTVNGFSIIASITPCDRKQIEQGKQLLINWLNDIIETIKTI